MPNNPSAPALPDEEVIRKLSGRPLAEAIAFHVFEEGPGSERASQRWTLDATTEAEQTIIRKLGLPSYVGSLIALLDGDANKAIVAAPPYRLRACLLALKRDSEETGHA